MKRNVLAKQNLKKSLIFAGGVGFGSVGLGLAVSIPIYFKIKKELSKSVEDLASLSSYMSDLTAKLGIRPDENFQAELAGGYKLVYENGETKIYSMEGGTRTLMMNLNKDGSLGAASTLTGPAALGMLQVIQSAKDTLSTEADAMKDVLAPFVKASIDTSTRVEAGFLGTTEEAIRARNALANPDADAAKEALEQLAKDAGMSVEQLKASASSAAIPKDVAARFAIAENDLKVKIGQIIKEFWTNYRSKISVKDLGILPTDMDLITDLFAKADIASIDAWISQQSLEEIQKTHEAIKSVLNEITSMAQARINQGKQELDHADSSADILSKIASKLDSLINAIARSYGYDNKLDPNETHVNPSQNIRDKLIAKAKEFGMSDKNIGGIVKEVERIIIEIGNGANGLPTKRVTFANVVDTLKDTSTSLSKILVSSVTITHYNQNGKIDTINEYMISSIGDNTQPGKFVDQLLIKDKAFISDVTYSNNFQNMLNMIKTLTMYAGTKIESELTAKSIEKLASLVSNPNAFNGQNQIVYNDQLIHLAQMIDNLQSSSSKSFDDLEKFAFLKKWYTTLMDEIFSGRDIQFTSGTISRLLVELFKKEVPSSITPSLGVYDENTASNYFGPMSKILMNFIDSKQRDNKEPVYLSFLAMVGLCNKLDSSNLAKLMQNQSVFNDLLLGKISTIPSWDISAKTINEHVFSLNGINDTDLNMVLSIYFDEVFKDVFDEKLTKEVFNNKITNLVNDINRYHQVNSNFDISTPDNKQKITAAAGVSTTLSSNGLGQQDVAIIQDKVAALMTSPQTQWLTANQFKTIVLYTNTVFEVLSPQEAAVELKQVLDPTKIDQTNISKIEKFNQWIEEIRKNHPTGRITKDEIEQYVWMNGGVTTKEMISNPDLITSLTANGDKYMVTGAVATDTGDVFSLLHIQGSPRIAKLSSNGGQVVVSLQSAFDPNAPKNWTSNPEYVHDLNSVFGMTIDQDSSELYQWVLNENANDPQNRVMHKVQMSFDNSVDFAQGVTKYMRIFKIYDYDSVQGTAKIFGVIERQQDLFVEGTVHFKNGILDTTKPIVFSKVNHSSEIGSQVLGKNGDLYAFNTYESKNNNNNHLYVFASRYGDVVVWNREEDKVYKFNFNPLISFNGITIDKTSGNAFILDKNGNVYRFDLEKINFNNLSSSSNPHLIKILDVSKIPDYQTKLVNREFRGIYFNPQTYEISIFNQGFIDKTSASATGIYDIFMTSRSQDIKNIFGYLLD